MGKECNFNVGDKVDKKCGYMYPGVVLSKFKTLNGEIRYVVELYHESGLGRGMLHIFNGEQLKLRKDDD